MSKGTRFVLVFSSLLVLAGGILLSIGLSMGGTLNTSFYFNNGKFHFVDNSTDLVSKDIALDAFDNIKIETSIIDVNIIEGSSYSISYSTRESLEPEITCDYNTLWVTSKQSGVNFGIFGFNTGKNEHITITIPAGASTKNLELKASTADITVDKVNVGGSITTSTGDINIKNVSSDKLQLTSSTGDKTITNCNIDELNETSSTGDVKYENCTAVNLSTKSSTGEIIINGLTTTSLTANASTGDIKVTDTSADFITANASTGDVKLELVGSAKEYNYKLNSSTGSIQIDGEKYKKSYTRDEDCYRTIKSKTSTGDIKIDFK